MYLPGNLPIPVNQSGNSFIKSSVDLMGLAAVAVGADVGLGVLVSGWATVMAQFILQLLAFCMMGDLGWQDQECL